MACAVDVMSFRRSSLRALRHSERRLFASSLTLVAFTQYHRLEEAGIRR